MLVELGNHSFTISGFGILTNQRLKCVRNFYLYFSGIGYIINIQSKTGELVKQAERK